MEFDIITLARSVSWVLVSLVILIATRDYFVTNSSSRVAYHLARILAWLFIVFNVGVAIYIVINM